jgi:hypothetical protein
VSETVDVNRIAAEVILTATERAVSTVASPARGALRRALQGLTDAYRTYLEQTYSRVRTIRTFLKPNEPVDLLEHYVPVTLALNSKRHAVEDVIDLATKNGRIIISGLAGRGKSVLMRFIALSLYHAPRGKIPLIIDLRSLNNLSSKDILRFIHAQYRGRGRVRFEDFQLALHKGYFSLLMDGFDEIDPTVRQEVEGQILALGREYKRTPIVVSGRPDDRFSSWDDFSVFHVCPMTLAQIKQLITNAEYDDDVKRTFLKRLTDDFFKQHESFLSTPLLAIMLMLTFEEYAEIPNSLHVFYRNAFETLVRRHDAMKAQFLRKTHSNCTADELQRIFASFCVLTYSKSKFQFNEEEVLNYVAKSLIQQRIKSDSRQLLSDLTESICLLQKEGFEISFVHRSFQEYFCALFVSQAPAGVVSKYLESGKFRVEDNVLPMLYGMVPERLESEWANQAVEQLISKYENDDRKISLRFFQRLFPTLRFAVFEDLSVHILMDDDPSQFRTVEILRRLYPAHFHATERKKSRASDFSTQWNKAVIEELRKLQKAGDPALRKLPPVGSRSNKIWEMPIQLSPRHDQLMRAAGFDEYARRLIRTLRAIRTDQQARADGDDTFLEAIFS